MQNNEQNKLVSAIIIAGVLIAGAILLKGSSVPAPAGPTNAPTGGNNNAVVATAPSPIGPTDQVLGNPQAKVTIFLYEDFQCPFCGKFFSESEKNIRDTYIRNGQVKLVYRDFAFLGPESVRASEAARCAGDQGKFWEYYDYLFTHQNGENQGNFSDPRLKSFAQELNLNTANFDKCLDGNKYQKFIADLKSEATKAGVSGTPKGFILKNGKVVSTIDGAEPYEMTKTKIESALK